VSIEVEDLVKYYGSHKALDSISFKAEPGKILGFLGPNGAGKSTTMKILSGFLPANSGKVLISGYNMVTDSLAARFKIGYLPENNPLYLDMYIPEFLEFTAEIFKIKKKREAVIRVLDMTGLGPMQGKKIGQLSKGYRQRVGLAQALISDPEVLILDEPTSGLDPNQLVDIRNLIRELGRTRTVILSTHIMQEVEILCEQVIIINAGKIVANDSVSNIVSRGQDRIAYRVEFDKPIREEDLLALPEVMEVSALPDIQNGTEGRGYQYALITKSDQRIRENVFDFAVRNQAILLGLKKVESDLSAIFQQLTRNPS